MNSKYSRNNNFFLKAAFVILNLFLISVYLYPATIEEERVRRIQQRIQVTKRLTDVTVQNRGGEYVNGLSPADFLLEVDGKSVAVKFVEEYAAPEERTVREYLEKLNRAKAEGKELPPPPTPPRFVVFVFDQDNLGAQAALQARLLAKKIVLNVLLPYDKVTILAYNRFFITLCPPTSDRIKILTAIDTTVGENSTPFYVPGEFEYKPTGAYHSTTIKKQRDEYYQAKRKSFDNYVASMDALASTLNSIPGRKTCLLFSEGVHLYAEYFSRFFKNKGEDLVRKFNSANTSIFAVRPGPKTPEWLSRAYAEIRKKPVNLKRNSLIFRRVDRIRSEKIRFLSGISSRTGGEYFDAEITESEILTAIQRDIGNYYILGFEPEVGGDGVFHSISIKSKRPDCKVKHRTGFFEKKKYAWLSPEEKLSQLEESFLSPGVLDELNLSAQAYSVPLRGGRFALLSIEFDSSELLTSPETGGELEMMLRLVDSQGQIKHQIRSLFRLEPGRELTDKLWLTREVPLSGGWCAVNIALRDNATGRISTWNKVFEKRDVESGRPVNGDAMFLSQLNEGSLLAWKEEPIQGKVAKPSSVFESAVGGPVRPLLQGAVAQGESAMVFVTIGNLPAGFDPFKADLHVRFILDPSENQGYLLSASDVRLRYLPDDGLLFITASVPIGFAQRESGRLCVAVSGAGNEVLVSGTPYRIDSFSPEKSKEFLADDKISPPNFQEADQSNPDPDTDSKPVEPERPREREEADLSPRLDMPTTQQTVRVVYRLTDVVVHDGEGDFVENLGKDDFALEIDGEPFEIKAVDEYRTPSLDDARVSRFVELSKEAKERGEKLPAAPTQPRFVIIIFDRYNLSDAGIRESIQAAKKVVVEGLLPYDRIAVFLYNGRIETLCGPTTDRDRILEAVEAANVKSNNIHWRLAEEGKRIKDFQNYIESIKFLANSFELLPGRKSYLLFSEGPVLFEKQLPEERDECFRRLPSDVRPVAERLADYMAPGLLAWELQELSQYLASSNATLHVIHRGPVQPVWFDRDKASYDFSKDKLSSLEPRLVSNPFAFMWLSIVHSRDMQDKRLELLRVAADLNSGKFYESDISDEELIESLRQEVGNYYLLGFVPPEGEDGGFHEINVTADNFEYTVNHRRGFFREKAFALMTPQERTIHLEEGFLVPGARNELGLRARCFRLPALDKHQVLLSLILDSEKIKLSEDGDYRLELVINVEDEQGRIRFRTHKIFTAGRKEELTPRLWLTENVPIIPEGCAVFLAIRDNATGKRATWKGEIEGLEFEEGIVVVTPILASTDPSGNLAGWDSEIPDDPFEPLEPLAPTGIDFLWRPLIDNAVPQGGEALVVMFVGNLPAETDSQPPEVSLRFILDPSEEQSYELISREQEVESFPGRRMLVVTSCVPLGLAQRRSGRMLVKVSGFDEGREIYVDIPYSITGFSQQAAEQLLNDNGIRPLNPNSK